AAASVGAPSRTRSDWRTGSCGASQGAVTATNASSTTNATPHATRRRVRRATRPPRVASAGSASTATESRSGEAMRELDGVVDDDENDRGEEEHALHDRIVAVVDRVDRKAAEAGPREHGLGHDGGAQQRPELQPGDRQNGNGRVAEGVLGHHAP